MCYLANYIQEGNLSSNNFNLSTRPYYGRSVLYPWCFAVVNMFLTHDAPQGESAAAQPLHQPHAEQREEEVSERSDRH